MKPNASLLDLLLEAQNLDRVPRSGYVLRGVADPESVAEHSWHVALMVWAFLPRLPHLDGRRVLEMALVHDLAEVRIGDLPATARRYFDAGAKAQAEKNAMDDLLAPLPVEQHGLFLEYQAGETSEARFVKACDKLQLMIKVFVYERAGAGALAEFWSNSQNFPTDEFPPIHEVFEELRQRRRDLESYTVVGRATP